MDSNEFRRGARRLEDAFFMEQDRILIEKRDRLAQHKRTKVELSAVSGIHNDHLLEKLMELEISPKELAAISIAPLVAMAWSDGAVDDKERTATMAAAEKMGFAKGSECYEILGDWLTHKPKTELLDSWVHYVEAIVAEMSAEDVKAFREEILAHAAMVAKASGGVFGIASVSAAEKAVLAQLESAFERPKPAARAN